MNLGIFLFGRIVDFYFCPGLKFSIRGSGEISGFLEICYFIAHVQLKTYFFGFFYLQIIDDLRKTKKKILIDVTINS